MKNCILSMIVIMLFSNCRKDALNTVVYYNFQSSDRERLLPYTENQVLVFKSQTGQERNFQVCCVSKNYKEWHTVGMGFFTTYAASYYYYDTKEIEFVSKPATVGGFRIQFTRWPEDTELAESNIYKKFPSKLTAYFSSFPYWNAKDASGNASHSIIIDYTLPKIKMLVNGVNYEQVMVFRSNNDLPLNLSYLNYPKDVNVIYYDERQGLIGFDDINGNQWRLN